MQTEFFLAKCNSEFSRNIEESMKSGRDYLQHGNLRSVLFALSTAIFIFCCIPMFSSLGGDVVDRNNDEIYV